MLVADPPIFKITNRIPTVYFKQATLLSILLHSFLLLFIAQQSNHTAYRKSDAKQPIRIYFQTGVVENNQLQIEEHTQQAPAEASRAQPPSALAPSAAKILENTGPPTEVIAIEAKPKVPTFNLNDAKKSLYLPSNTNMHSCNQKERESQIRNCDKDGSQLWRKKNSDYQAAIASTFKHPEKGVSETFNRNMRRVENLLLIQEQLEKQIDKSNPAHQILIEEHRSITNEIQMIDKQYQEVNLLKVLGSGVKAIRKAIDSED